MRINATTVFLTYLSPKTAQYCPINTKLILPVYKENQNRKKRKRLFTEAVSANKKLFTETVSANEKLFTKTGLPIEKKR